MVKWMDFLFGQLMHCAQGSQQMWLTAQVTQAHCVRHVGIKIWRTYEAKFKSENLLENGNKNR